MSAARLPPDADWAVSHRGVYERQAEEFDRHRGRRLIERAWLDRFRALVPAGETVLDLGCGAGEPIARYLIDQGHEVLGVDFAEPMLEIARARFPEASWINADMRALDLGRRFGGIVAWDSFFHLTRDEQRAVIPRLGRHLVPRGSLLLTVGPSDGEVTGTVEGESVYHASLSPEEYERLFRAAGLRVVDFVAEDLLCDFHSVLLGAADL
jgi:cyclopropane fatty-acyl-phospholipid synthase-like methyltransferase